MTDKIEKNNNAKRSIIILSVGLFLLSLTQKCFCTTNECSDSIAVFLVGWLGIPLGGASLAWLANPLLILSWYMTKRNSRHSLTVSLLATLACFSFLLFDTVIVNEGGGSERVVSYKTGYWLWVSSAATMFVGNIILRQSKHDNKTVS